MLAIPQATLVLHGPGGVYRLTCRILNAVVKFAAISMISGLFYAMERAHPRVIVRSLEPVQLPGAAVVCYPDRLAGMFALHRTRST